MNFNQDTIGLIKQRLEILWQLVESLETGGGGGGTSNYSELSNKPQINSTTLEGNKTAAQLGLATSTSVSGLTERFEDLFALDNVSLENNQEYPTSIESLLALHEPLNINNVNYYFFEESGIDYSYFAIDTSGAYPKISYAQFLKDSHRVVFYDFATDTVPTQNSDNFITSGGVNTALGDFYTKTEVDNKDEAILSNDGVKNLVGYNLTVPQELSATINNDGSITVIANTTDVRRLTISTDLSKLVDGSDYILSGCTGGNADSTYHLGITRSNYSGVVYQTNSEVSFTKTNEMTLLVLTVRAGQQWTKTFYPMIRKANITNGDFVRYAPNNYDLYSNFSNYYNKTEVDSKDGAVVDNDGVKNLLILNPPSTSSGGVNLTVNADGTITTTGSTTSTYAAFILNNNVVLPAGDYILSGCPSGGGDATYRIDISGTQSYDIGSGVQFTSTGAAITVRIRIGANIDVNNFVWKPMIRKASITNGDFVSYAPNNHELWEMIKALQPTVNNSLRTLNLEEEVIEEEELTEKRDDTNGDNR